MHSIANFFICLTLFESTLFNFCKTQSKLVLQTLRQDRFFATLAKHWKECCYCAVIEHRYEKGNMCSNISRN